MTIKTKSAREFRNTASFYVKYTWHGKLTAKLKSWNDIPCDICPDLLHAISTNLQYLSVLLGMQWREELLQSAKDKSWWHYKLVCTYHQHVCDWGQSLQHSNEIIHLNTSTYICVYIQTCTHIAAVRENILIIAYSVDVTTWLLHHTHCTISDWVFTSGQWLYMYIYLLTLYPGSN